MKLVNDIYNMYRDKLIGEEEDVTTLVMGLLHERTKEEMMSWVNDMQETEVYQMLGLYLLEMLRLKLADEGIPLQPRQDAGAQRFH
ncbi:hypothetical protein DFP93_11165 [Aneurinibacillus soli]|uniref:Uncharacterized protein n=1 Tax=Aneurinibacillus soli TaxID=1500254 RepID=A0A0U4WDC0_9BACL|nr:DUF6154 family protein [Aneurinibacillus soli]PYE60888.1 hypothetical protein DFP93_11165 [Aneurinibacillus soli]BAU26793.1 hypothetical protein CB4_00962 [Aneurinibacillus soli]